MSDDMKNEGVDRLLATVKRDGVAVSSVRDGTVLVFTRSFLQEVLNKYSNETISIFVKRPDVN